MHKGAGHPSIGPHLERAHPAQASVRHARAQRKGRWDEFKLWQMGYKQEMPRTFTAFNCFACSISIMSLFTLVETYSLQGLTYGGPVVVIWGWVAVGLLTLCIALSMAELLSAYPTSGGLYYWSYILAPPWCRGIICWMAGFINLAGQIAFTASTELALVRFIGTLVTLHSTLGGDGSPGYQLTEVQIMLLFGGLLAIHAMMNSVSQQFTSLCITFSGLWHLVAVAVFTILLPLLAPSHQETDTVWLEWQPNTDVHGITSPVYIVLVGLLMSQWTMTGFDVVVNVCEETIDPDLTGSWALPASVVAVLVSGLGLLLSLTYSIQSLDSLFDLESVTGGKAIAQLTWDVFSARYGSGRGAVPLLYIPAVGLFFCAFICMASGGRMVYAFSRDGAMLGADFARHVSSNSQPLAGTWLMAGLCFVFGVSGCFSLVAYSTLSSTSVVALAISFGIPIALRIWNGADGFVSGPFRLGWWSRPVGLVSCGWILVSTIAFVLPPLYPLTPITYNYTPVLLAAIVIFSCTTWWAPRVGACHWFTGPKPNVTVQLGDQPRRRRSADESTPDVSLDIRAAVKLGSFEEPQPDIRSASAEPPLQAISNPLVPPGGSDEPAIRPPFCGL